MARKRSTQKGCVEPKGGRLTLRYAVRDGQKASGWRFIREFLPTDITEVEAERIRVERMQTINRLNNSLVTQPIMSLQQFTDTLWREYLANHEVKPSTIYSYDSMLKSLVLPSLGAKTVDQITPVRLSQLFKAAREKYSSKYQLNLYSLLKVMFEVAREFELIEQSPVKPKLHKPKHERKEKKAYTVEQVRAIVANFPEEHEVLALVAAMTGVRLGELLAFRWQDFDGTAIHVKHSSWRGQLQSPKTEGSKNRIPLTPGIAELLAERQGRAEEYIFSRPDGRPLDADHMRRQVLYPALRAAGIEILPRQNGFHAFRHTAGSLLYELTRDLQMVKGFLRHSRIATTSDIYLHVNESVQGEATATLASVLLQ